MQKKPKNHPKKAVWESENYKYSLTREKNMNQNKQQQPQKLPTKSITAKVIAAVRNTILITKVVDYIQWVR